MTTKAELTKLFHFDPKTPRISAYGRNAMIASDPIGQATALGVTAELLSPDTKKPSGKWLFFQLLPRDAVNLAIGILAVAKEKGWPIPAEYEALREQDRAKPH